MITFIRCLISRWRMRKAFVRLDVEFKPHIEPLCNRDIVQYFKDQERWCEFCGTSGYCNLCQTQHK